ncbi:MAG TPA: hypothetical protein VK465_18000 [Fibrobacteria bacterium]|nr:hypothetical protein [Fibrobacteria bacterium]
MTQTERDPYALDSTSRLDSVIWYLMATGFMAILGAGLFLFLREIRYEDYVLNGAALGRYLLGAGVVLYFTGRILSFYRKFRKKKAGDRALND